MRFELEFCELGEERMDTEPSAVLQLDDEEVRVLQHFEAGGSAETPKTTSAKLGSEVTEDDVRNKNQRDSSSRELRISWFR